MSITSRACFDVLYKRLIKSVEGRLPVNTVDCCGIVGYCGTEDASKILMDGIELLQNRGYDSCGVTTLDNGTATAKLVTTKFASKGSTSDCVQLLKGSIGERHAGHTMGIAHTRWATHGGKTDANAHPHQDYRGRISLVHNGTIDNYEELKSELEKRGIRFKSQTDTEVIANLIGMYLDEGKNFEQAVSKAVGRLRGTWGLLIMHKDEPNGFMCARNGSPLVLGAAAARPSSGSRQEGSDALYIASEPLALARYTNEYLSLNDGDIVHVTKKGGISHLQSGRDMRKIYVQNVQSDPAPFRHWTMKEIYEQPQAIARALSFGGRIRVSDSAQRTVKLGGLDDNRTQLLAMKNLLITGCGTSYYAGLFGELLFRYLKAFDNVNIVDSSDVDVSFFARPYSTLGMLALTQSGETRDVVQALEQAEKLGVKRLSVVNVVGSLVARMTNCGVYIHAGREVAVASTKAFTSQVIALALIGIWFAQNRRSSAQHAEKIEQLLNALTRMPLLTSQILGLDDQCKSIAQQLSKAESLFVLGKGFGQPVALEGALKIKEISYVHAEGFGGGQMKHGPFALIDEKRKTPVIMIVLNDAHGAAMLNAVQQVKARGAKVICITDSPSMVQSLADHTIKIPENGPLTALGAVIPLQMIAYHIAILRGVDPDKPRGLAKTVTVA